MCKSLYKNILALYRYRNFRIGVAYFASPCRIQTKKNNIFEEQSQLNSMRNHKYLITDMVFQDHIGQNAVLLQYCTLSAPVSNFTTFHGLKNLNMNSQDFS